MTAPAKAPLARTADFWFDPVCPWTWLTSRWMLEVTKVREVTVRWHLFSLVQLNEGRDVSADYRKLLATAYGPIRVIAAARAHSGDDIVLPLYTAMGTRIHVQGNEDFPSAIDAALAELGLPGELAEAATSTRFDDAIRADHDKGIEQVGDDVGVPIVKFEGVAFFGPVVTPSPKGEAAGRLWDGVLLVAGTPEFFELKRSRTQDPIFD